MVVLARFLLLWVVLLALLPIPTAQAVSRCTVAPSDPVVTTSDVPESFSAFVMPVGADHTHLDLLSIRRFATFDYPKIRFNDNLDANADPSEWYVATAHNQDRWLHNGWNAEPSSNRSSLYQGGQHHPGEDWNLTEGTTNDLGEAIYPMAHGKVLYRSSIPVQGYGNIVIILHKVYRLQSQPAYDPIIEYDYVTSFYAHMQEPSPFKKGDLVNAAIDVIGYVGRSGLTQNVPHLHFEIRKNSMVTIDPATNEVCLRYPPGMWPAARYPNDQGEAFIRENYYDPSYFLFDHVARLDMQMMLPPTGKHGRDARFKGPKRGTFGKDWSAWQDDNWVLRWMNWHFSDDRTVIVLHVTYKADSSLRYLGFYDPDRNNRWSGWIRIAPY